MVMLRLKKYCLVGSSAAALVFACACNGESDEPVDHGNEAGQGGESGSGQSGESGSGQSGATHNAGGAASGAGGQAGNGEGGNRQADGGAAGSLPAPCVAPEGPDGESCPDGYEPLDGDLLDEQNGCLTSPTVLTCRTSGTGAWWCVVDTDDDSVYYVPEMTCSHTSRFRAGTEEECGSVPEMCE